MPRAGSQLPVESVRAAEFAFFGTVRRLGARLGSTRGVLAHSLERHRSVFTRLAIGYGLEAAEVEVEAARKARRLKDQAPWLRGLERRWQPLAAMLTEVAGRDDPLWIRPQLKLVPPALHSGQAAALVLLDSLLERLDSQITAEQLAVGDVADILQTVRWQEELVASGSPSVKRNQQAARQLRTLCRGFITDWETRAVGPADYPRLIEQLLPSLERFCAAVADEKTRELLAELGSHRDPAALQGAHRRLMLNLERQPG